MKLGAILGTFVAVVLAVGGAVDCDLAGSGVNSDQVAAHRSGTFSSVFR